MPVERIGRRLFLSALIVNFIWINLSEIVRYLWVVRPMLQAAYPGQAHVAPMDFAVFALWGIWDMLLILGATGFFWLWLDKFGAQWQQIVLASLGFTLTVFGLIWLGVANMGLAPYAIIVVALPLAWVELVISCYIVSVFYQRVQALSSIRSI